MDYIYLKTKLINFSEAVEYPELSLSYRNTYPYSGETVILVPVPFLINYYNDTALVLCANRVPAYVDYYDYGKFNSNKIDPFLKMQFGLTLVWVDKLKTELEQNGIHLS